MTKTELRKIYKEKRSWLSFAEEEKFADLILINFQTIDLPFISCAHIYIASEKLREADTFAIARYMRFKNPGLRILVPRIDIASGNMEHLHFREETELIENRFGIAEPAGGEIFSPKEIDLVIVPLLAFDKRGFRVGYGKGYYDKFLSECRRDVIKIGLSFFKPEEQIDGINQFDISLNYCVTPQEIFEF